MRRSLELTGALNHVLPVTLNSFGTELSKEQRAKLFPTIGRLYPEGNNALARAEDVDTVKACVEYIPEYKAFFDNASKSTGSSGGASGGEDSDGASLEDEFFKREVSVNRDTFLQQFGLAVFYSFVKLKEQVSPRLYGVLLCRYAADRLSIYLNETGGAQPDMDSGVHVSRSRDRSSLTVLKY
jgi:V-type H+-transporting ATPase subunit d